MINQSKTILKILAESIKSVRTSKNIRIEELASKTGIRKEYLEKIEKGEAYGIKTSHLFIIADALNIKPHELVEKLYN